MYLQPPKYDADRVTPGKFPRRRDQRRCIDTARAAMPFHPPCQVVILHQGQRLNAPDLVIDIAADKNA